jgi:hypothetical protein
VIPLIGELMIPFILSTLADHNNEASESVRRRANPASVGRVLVRAVVSPPVAIAIIQSKLNEAAERAKHLLNPNLLFERLDSGNATHRLETELDRCRRGEASGVSLVVPCSSRELHWRRQKPERWRA